MLVSNPRGHRLLRRTARHSERLGPRQGLQGREARENGTTFAITPRPRWWGAHAEPSLGRGLVGVAHSQGRAGPLLRADEGSQATWARTTWRPQTSFHPSPASTDGAHTADGTQTPRITVNEKTSGKPTGLPSAILYNSWYFIACKFTVFKLYSRGEHWPQFPNGHHSQPDVPLLTRSARGPCPAGTPTSKHG